MRKLAHERGGRCLSDAFVNVKTHLRWQCSHGHEWQTIPYLVLNGSWCPVCAGRKAPDDVLAEMRKAARARGGKCLSRKYTKAKDGYEWECGKGHRWRATWDDVKHGRWCPICLGRLPPDQAIEQLREIARSKGGRCLSDRFVDVTTKLEFECSEGHRWETAPANIRGGRWCPRCAGNVPPTMEELHTMARERGGACLSKRYVNGHTKLRWRCEKGHVWWAAPTAVKSGTWCPKCAVASRYTLDDMKTIAAERGGLCLSKRFRSLRDRLHWRCSEGHEWRATASQILSTGTWCPACVGVQRGTLAQARKLARANAGKCLSTRYVNVKTKLRWHCGEGHEWEATVSSIRRGAWCPYCQRRGSKGIGDYLLADMQQAAKGRGGACLSRSYVDALTPLRWRCQVGHEWTAPAASVVVGSWCPECAHTRKPPLELFQELARERGGRCLSECYVNGTTPLAFECEHGHRWSTRPAVVRRSWCPECARKQGHAHDGHA